MNEDNNNVSQQDDLEQAYANDLERRLHREEDLQAARDYLGVLLEEAEDRNTELEGKRLEADRLAERLSITENEIQELKKENSLNVKQSKKITLWMCLSVVELIIIAGLVLALYFKIEVSNGHTIGFGDVSIGSENITPEITPEVTIAPAVQTAFYNSDLANVVKYISAETIAPFTVSIEKCDGLEYLVFTSGDIKVYYKNEYYPEDMNFRKSVMVENGDKRYTFLGNYDLTDDIVSLCPKFTTIGNVKYLSFVKYNKGAGGIPDSIRLLSCDEFRMYECTELKYMVLNLMKVEVLQEKSVYEDYPCVYSLSTSKASYKYCISESDYTDIQYYEYDVPEIESNFKFEISENGITWNSLVMLGNKYYMGKISGELGVKDTGMYITGAKFGAFVPFNQEDPNLQGYIMTAEAVPERYVTVSGYNSERFYIAVSDEVDLCEYYWENLNTDDSNNWIYYDADGNQVSKRGIDVSKYQGNIDWQKVAAQGIDFAIIRLGYRGMNEGTLEIDNYYLNNIKGTQKNNIDTGVYFFSQALNEEEAKEEAQFVLNAIKDYDITYPVIIDTERVTTYAARANELTSEERTQICKVFCDIISEAGYTPMIYANTKYMLMGLDLTQLNDYDKWFACYSSDITFPYDFEILQYSESGSIDGITGKVDLNISFVDYSQK